MIGMPIAQKPSEHVYGGFNEQGILSAILSFGTGCQFWALELPDALAVSIPHGVEH